MKFRLQEGNGLCFYKIGVQDDGTPVGINKEEMFFTLSILYI